MAPIVKNCTLLKPKRNRAFCIFTMYLIGGLAVFRDRVEAGMRLAEELLDYRKKDVIVLAIPRGGVCVESHSRA